MTPRERILIGGLGGAAPVLLNLLVVDIVSSLAGLTLLVALAYGVRMLAMVAAGALAGWLHEDERKAVKLFQLGMVAPALLTGMINGAALRVDAGTHEVSASLTQDTFHAGIWVMPTVHAAQQARQFSLPAETVSQQLVRGLLGIRNNPRDWIVEVASAQTATAAQTALASYRRTYPHLTFTLFEPTTGVTTTWLVTVNGQMTASEAVAAREQLTRTPSLVTSVRRLTDDRITKR